MNRRTDVNILLCTLLVLALVACGGAGDPGSPSEPRPLEDIVGDPEAYDGARVTVTASYLTSFERNVLTPGLADSFPPQAMTPEIWLEGAPPARCTEEAQNTRWAERVVASGTFRYRADGGFGHLGAYEMALEDATVECA